MFGHLLMRASPSLRLSDVAAELAGVRAQVDAAVAYSCDVVVFISSDGTVHSASPACRRLFGVEPADLVGRNSLDLILPDERELIVAAFATIPNLGDHTRLEFHFVNAKGEVQWVEAIVTNLIDDPNVGFVVVNLRDMTDRVNGEKAVRFQAALLAAAGQAIVGSDTDGFVVYWNAAAEALYGWSADEAIGRPAAAIFEPVGGWDLVADESISRLLADEPWTGELLAKTKSGVPIPVLLTCTLVHEDGVLVGRIGVSSDISERLQNEEAAALLVQRIEVDRLRLLAADRRAAEAALVYAATYDSLTDLPNRASLHATLQGAMSQADADHVVALAVIDIDRFKLVTDGLRHSSGDQALKALATRFRSSLRPSDVVVSMTGDGFAVVRIGVETLDDAHRLGNDIMVLLDDPLVLDDRELSLTVSVGVTLSTETDSPESLLRDADDAMYQAKQEGRNQVKVFDHHARSRAHRRQSITMALPKVFERNELYLEFQPILDLATGEVAGFESLLRWNHPDLGSVGPGEFIPIAEATGLILRIGAWVLDHSLQQLSLWRDNPRVTQDLWMAINVSAQQLLDPRLVEQVRAATDRAGVPASAVHLEITESVLMERVDNALGTIIELQASGFSVSIDDFGTGYSSLSYLSRLPIDTVKIDGSFVSGLGNRSGHDASIVRAVIALADALDLAVVAEGVELATQLDFLTELGCTYGQGFLWSRAVSAADALIWMIDRVGMLPPPDRDKPASTQETGESATDVGAAIIEIANITGRRRRGPIDQLNVLRFDSLEIGLDAGRAWIAGRDVDLAAKEFELLAFLAQHAGETFSRRELLQEVWHSSPAWQKPTTVTEHIHRLRSRIEPDPTRPRLICTVRGSGYCFGPPKIVTVAS